MRTRLGEGTQLSKRNKGRHSTHNWPIHLSNRWPGKAGRFPANADGAFRSHSPFIRSTSSRESIFSSPPGTPIPASLLGGGRVRVTPLLPPPAKPRGGRKCSPTASSPSNGQEQLFKIYSIDRMLFYPGVTFSYSVRRTIATGAKPSLMWGEGDGWSAGGKKLLVFCSSSARREAGL